MITRPYLAAAVCMTSTPDFEANLLQAEGLVAEAVRRGAELVGLPENFPQICESSQEVAAQAHETYLRAIAWLSEQAYRHGIVLYAGVIAPPVEGSTRVRNVLVVMGRDGNEIARYQKRHMFDVYFGDGNTFVESETVEPGIEPVVADLGELGKLGLSICYDLRFPEHFRALVDQGAEILTVPAAFLTKTGMDHWHVLLRARAIENTSYLLAPAQGGRHNAKRASYGHALVIDPWGHVLADTGDVPGVAIAEINHERIQTVRGQLPCLTHRRI